MSRQDNRNRLYHYSIRKTSLGVGSVVVGLFLAGAMLPDVTLAEEVVGTSASVSPAVEMSEEATRNDSSISGEGMEAIAEEDVAVSEGQDASLDMEGRAESQAVDATPTTAFRKAEEQPATETHTVLLQNEHISRRFQVENGHLRTESIENKLNGERLVFEEGSKEFTIQFKPGEGAEAAPTMPAYVPESDDRASWTATASSQANADATEGPVSLALDGDLVSRWHSNYHSAGQGPTNTLPAHVEFTFAQPKDVRTFIYIPRQDGADNGVIKDYKIYVRREDETDYVLAQAGSITDNPKKAQLIDLGELKTGIKSIKFEALNAHNGQPFAAAAEFDVSSRTPDEIRKAQQERQADYVKKLEAYQSGFQISLDKLTLAKDGVARQTRPDGETLTFTFTPYQYQNVPVSIKYVVDLKKDAKFSQAHLLISVPEEQKSQLTIESIDLQSFKLKADQSYEEFSKQANIAEMSGFNGFYAGLGQPVYVGSFYTGSEFPLAWNSVEATGKTLFSRYYSGKTFAQLDLDKDGNFRTWNTVFGVARTSDYQVIQQDFYAYLAKIGQDTYFRKQYNSWFDHMKDITAENIQSSFNEIERGFTNGGISPLHSYVVDDGWQTVPSLWEFNNKFPNKLYDSSKQVKRFGSDFGLWLGPQGGYGNPHVMAQALERTGKGSMHAGVVYIGDKRYTDGLTKLFEEYDKEFDINYWKLDGLLLNPRAKTDEHGIGGGYLNMYSMTETHERWIKLYETIREHATDPDKMWINLTSYIPPSPWFLQWVNSIWMQNAGDVDYQDGVKKREYAHLDFGNDAAEAITYRDDRYEELVKTRKWQLPFANIYNHDPVYGNTAHSSKRQSPGGPARQKIQFSTDDLRDYLYMLGTRGTGFWEFYYSASMMDDAKWQVNGEAVNWIESNYETLKHAVFHGGKPGHGEVYGYSAWDENKGIVSVRNPIDKTQTYSLTLDRLAGMREGTVKLYRTTVHGDKRHDTTALTNYGDSLTVTLNPYETLVFEYNTKVDTTPATVLTAKAGTARTISLLFDERVVLDNQSKFAVTGHQVESVSLGADFRTVTLTLTEDLKDRERVMVSYQGVKDNAAKANVATGQVSVTAYDKGIILDISEVKPGQALTAEGVSGRGDFSVTVKTTLDKLGQTLAEQVGAWKLAVDAEGKVVFDVNGLQVKSAPFATIKAGDKGQADMLVTTGKEVTITAARTRNGSLKLYIDGTLHNSHFDAKKINETLEVGDVVVAPTGFAGSISRFILENGARDFETAQEVNSRLNPKPGKAVLPLDASLTVAPSFDPNDGGERPASSAIDLNPSTYWASHPNKDNRVEAQTLTIALEKPAEVGELRYVPRLTNLQATGDIHHAKFEYSLDGQTWKPLAVTNGEADHSIRFKPGAPSHAILFNPVEAKFFRLTALETYHWNAANKNKVVAVAELLPVIDVSPEAEQKLTTAYLRNALDKAASLMATDYTAESWAALTNALQTATPALAVTNQETINEELTKVLTALSGLKMAQADATGPGLVADDKPVYTGELSQVPADAPMVDDKPVYTGEVVHVPTDAPMVDDKPVHTGEVVHVPADAPMADDKPVYTGEVFHVPTDAPMVDDKPVYTGELSQVPTDAPMADDKPVYPLPASGKAVAQMDGQKTVAEASLPATGQEQTLALTMLGVGLFIAGLGRIKRRMD